MKNNGIYSLGKFLVIIVAIVAVGAGVATAYANVMMSAEAEINPNRMTTEPSLKILVWTDKEIYVPTDTMTIGIANPLEVRVDFEDNAYSLRFEKLVNGTWLKMLPIYDPASQEDSSLPSITETRGQDGKIEITYQLTPDFAEGMYRVISDGKATQNGTTVFVGGTSEFEISLNPQSPTP
jgi:hypothetical protein